MEPGRTPAGETLNEVLTQIPGFTRRFTARIALAQIGAAQRRWADDLGECIGEAVLRQAPTAPAAVRDALGDAGAP